MAKPAPDTIKAILGAVFAVAASLGYVQQTMPGAVEDGPAPQILNDHAAQLDDIRNAVAALQNLHLAATPGAPAQPAPPQPPAPDEKAADVPEEAPDGEGAEPEPQRPRWLVPLPKRDAQRWPSGQ